MELSETSTTEILAELKKRSKAKATKHSLVFGTIGMDGGRNFVEIFKEIKTEKDFDFIRNASLRARLNNNRNYQGFYFKTNGFKELEENLNKDNYGNVPPIGRKEISLFSCITETLALYLSYQ